MRNLITNLFRGCDQRDKFFARMRHLKSLRVYQMSSLAYSHNIASLGGMAYVLECQRLITIIDKGMDKMIALRKKARGH